MGLDWTLNTVNERADNVFYGAIVFFSFCLHAEDSML
jgi:hypothetical protein